ncbi:family 43 glycosylhydrolase [Rhodothermus marinus]|uniref:family 43 glycosylhydrolase n=1 Tax=Rhodothermus marinus TaxID=29549 RepID=UPI000AAC4D03|nr:family 43 glycosylhydrolase [Rhodothermus marinus]
MTRPLVIVWLVVAGTIGKLEAQPVNIRVHDPVLIRQDSVYYLFHTGRGIARWRSPDLRHWERMAPVFSEAPSWTEQVVPGFRQRNHIWAPDVLFYKGRYYLFYSVSAFAKNTSAIGVATSRTLDPSDPEYGWVDHGPVVRSIPGRDMWNAIDPNVAFDEQGAPWLAFGSFWLGIKLVRLDSTLLRLAEPQEWYTIAARPRTMTLDERDPGDGAIEAPFIFRKK